MSSREKKERIWGIGSDNGITELYGSESFGDENGQDSLAPGGEWGHEGCRARWDYPDGLSRPGR